LIAELPALKVGNLPSGTNCDVGAGLGAELGVETGVEVGLIVDEATLFTGAVGTTALGVTEPVLRPKLFKVAEDVDEVREAGTTPVEAGTTPVCPGALSQRPWHAGADTAGPAVSGCRPCPIALSAGTVVVVPVGVESALVVSVVVVPVGVESALVVSVVLVPVVVVSVLVVSVVVAPVSPGCRPCPIALSVLMVVDVLVVVVPVVVVSVVGVPTPAVPVSVGALAALSLALSPPAFGDGVLLLASVVVPAVVVVGVLVVVDGAVLVVAGAVVGAGAVLVVAGAGVAAAGCAGAEAGAAGFVATWIAFGLGLIASTSCSGERRSRAIPASVASSRASRTWRR
jgi:hypothetical protein